MYLCEFQKWYVCNKNWSCKYVCDGRMFWKVDKETEIHLQSLKSTPKYTLLDYQYFIIKSKMRCGFCSSAKVYWLVPSWFWLQINPFCFYTRNMKSTISVAFFILLLIQHCNVAENVDILFIFTVLIKCINTSMCTWMYVR